MSGYQVQASQELTALGLMNIFGAAFGAVPTQIGLSRMGIAYSIGCYSQLGSNIITAVVVGISLKVLAPVLYYVPMCTLSCIIIQGASHLIDTKTIKWLSLQYRDIKEVSVWMVAFLATVTL